MVALVASAVTAGVVSAQEPTPDHRGGSRFDVEAVRERLDRLAQGDAPAPTSRSAEASADVGASAIPTGLCYGPQYADPDEPGDVLLDAVVYSLGFDCVTSTWVMGADTIDAFADIDLGWFDLYIDSNNNMSDGCFGADYVAVVLHDGFGVLGGMFRTPSCDAARWSELTSAKMTYLRPAANQIAFTFNGAPLASSANLRWQSSITHWDENDPIDFMPDGTGYRSSPGNPCGLRCFYLTNGTTGGAAEIAFKDDQPANEILTGDWNADGVDSLGFRLGNTYALKNALAPTAPDVTFSYGRSSDDVLVGDWDGDGIDTLAVRRGNTYYLKNSFGSGAADIVVSYGRASDVVLVGDWDGNGTDTLAVRRGNLYYIKNSFTGGPADAVVGYGRSTDVVLVGDWDGDGDDTLGVRRGNIYYLKNSISGGAADVTFSFGKATDITFVGDWNADGRDTLGVRR